jgi:hypothetical protein
MTNRRTFRGGYGAVPPSLSEQVSRLYYGHLAMPLYRVYDFLFPVCVPLEFDGSLFDVPRRPFLYAWAVGAIRNVQIWKARRDCRPFRSAEENR